MTLLRLVFSFLSACLFISAANAESNHSEHSQSIQEPMDMAWIKDYSKFIRSEADEHNLPGYAFVFIQRGQDPIFVTHGKTSRKGAPINEQTLFRLASVSKTFTSVLMARWVEEQRIEWQTSLATLAPSVGFSRAGHDGMQLQHLIGQSSGFMPNAYDNLIEANYSVKRVLNALADLEPLCQPGECYTYQNALFGVLEDYFVSQNTSFHRELDQYIFEPLKMPHASTGKASLLSSSNWAKPHIAIAKDKWREGGVETNYYRFSPAAGVNASIEDMAIWLEAMLGEHPDVVSPAVIDTLTTPGVKTRRELNRRGWKSHLKNAHYGLGWRVYDFEGHKLAYHGGWVKGYRADVAFAPETGAGYAMLMNAESNLMNPFTAELWDRYFAQLAEQQKRLAASNIAAN